MITINSSEEMEKYYDAKTNTYRFVDEDDKCDDVIFKCDIKMKANIYAWNINALNVIAQNIDALNVIAQDINARDIDAQDIDAWDINARNIDAVDIDARNTNARNIDALHIFYYAVCIAYESFKCKSVTGYRDNAVHMCLDGEIEYKGEEEQ